MPSLTAFKKRTPYGGLIEHHLRIGDTEFYVPPTSVSVHRQMKNKRAQMLRSRNSLPKESGYSDKVIELTLFFPNMDAINLELRPLLAQVKKCPFLPVENTYLNDIHKVDAMTISGITVQTTPGFPHTLQAQIQGYAFEPYSYIADDTDRTFDQMFDWPLFRWYYQRNLDPQIASGFHTYFEPLYYDLDNSFKFRIVAQDDLDAMKKWKHDKKMLIKEFVNKKKGSFEGEGQLDENGGFYGNEELESEFSKEYEGMYDRAMYEYNLHYEDWDIPGLNLVDFSVGFENTISSQQIQMDESPTHQYMGSQDTMLVARFRTDNVESIASLESLVRRSTSLIRGYHKEIANGFLEFDNQLARLFGVKNVTIEDMKTTTIAGQPGSYEVSVSMIAYNRMERKLNEVQWLSETAEWDIDKYEDQGFMSLLTSLNPLTWGPDGGEDYDAADWAKSNPLYRWSRFIGDRPMFNKTLKGLKNFTKGQSKTAKQLDDEGIQQVIYDESILAVFRAAEVYPDLELPTYGEATMAGFDIPNTNNGVFVEPDFFIKYQKGTMWAEDLLAATQENYETILRDATGGEATVKDGDIVKTNDVTKKEIEQSQKDYNKAADNQINDTPIVKELVDKENISKSEMEALIREKADEYGINQNLPLGFARVMDEELKHFYDKGTNAKQSKVVNSNTSAPVMLNSDFSFYTNKENKVTGEYVGVMKVRKMYGSNVNMLGKNIEYNVDSGVRRMADFYTELERIHSPSASGSANIYKESNVYSLFGLKKGKGTWDDEKARFAGVIMFYLGFEKEYTALIKDNKKPPTKVTNLIKEMMKEITKKDEWSTQQIQNKVKGLPIKDFKTVGQQPSNEAAGMSEGDFNDDKKVHEGMLHDMIRYDMRGRLVRAFPTFFLNFIDEGQYIGTVKLSDQYFGYKAVMDIMYTNNRKEASSTLVLEMANIFGTLDDAEKGMDLTNTSYSEVMQTMTMPGAVARETERSRHRNPNYYKSIMLRTGTRIHFRMGYGSNPLNMPTIMNGTITSIQNNGESITVVAQDDGIELTNKIRADVNETTDGGFLFSKKEPTEIVDEILTDSQGFFKNMWAGLSNKEYENHSLGIMHFGSQGMPQGWTELTSFFGGQFTPATSEDAPLWEKALTTTGKALLGPVFNSIVAGRENREIAEINMNVYQTTGLTNEVQDKWWSQVKDAMGIGKADEPGINIGLYDKSPWDVLNIAASIGDDHIVAVHPFGFRNTIFSGKPYFPLHYGYVTDGDQVLGTAMKPFRQFHMYDSYTSILDNTIVANEENVRTVGVGVYMNEGEMDTTSPIYVDTNIWPEKQRVVNIDTSMNAQGVRLVQHIPLVGGLLNKPMKWYFDEGVAIKITARGLSDYVRDMYDGYLTVMGDPSVKPYDQMWINDEYSSINGPADVKEVTQIMNHQVGYITMIKPDAVVANSDKRIMGFWMSLQGVVGSAAMTMLLRYKLRRSKYAGNLPILNSFWAATQNGYERMKGRFKTGAKTTAKVYDKLTGKAPPNMEQIKKSIENRTGTGSKPKDIARWTKNGMLNQLTTIAGEEGKNNLLDVLDSSKKFGFNVVDNVKMKTKAGKLIASGASKLPTLLKGVGGMSKLAWGAVHVGAGPIGWIALAIEMLVVHLITATVGEFINRWLFMRQACIIAPLTKGGLEFTAGINGHKGSVIGDSPDFWQGLMTNKYSAFLLGFMGVDSRQYSQESREGGDLGLEATTSKAPSVDIGSMAKSIFDKSRKEVPYHSQIKTMYDEDRKASLQQINARLELLNKRDTVAVHDEEESTWDELKGQIGDWFGNLWGKVVDLIGSLKDSGTCVPKGDVPTTGKAKGLSSYFSVVGPKLEAEAKAQGLGAYIEILKAKTMQESGGNYKRYPDVMQASESMGKPIGYIKDVDASIKQGVKYFGTILKKSNGDIKMALQSYNFGGGFIDYCMKKGGKYTPELAMSFSKYMVGKVGRISRIAPGYGDVNYVKNVLRFYDGNLPSGECEGEGGVDSATSSCPTVVGSKGSTKYRTSTGSELTDLRSIPQAPFSIAIVGGTSKVRRGTAEVLVAACERYGKKMKVTSGWRPGDPNWHGTGWAVDIDTPNTMRTINGKMRFSNGSDKDNARKLVEACIQSGFHYLWFGDWDIVQEMNKKYGSGTMHYDPAGHWNHLHCSYPICKK